MRINIYVMFTEYLVWVRPWLSALQALPSCQHPVPLWGPYHYEFPEVVQLIWGRASTWTQPVWLSALAVNSCAMLHSSRSCIKGCGTFRTVSSVWLGCGWWEIEAEPSLLYIYTMLSPGRVERNQGFLSLSPRKQGFLSLSPRNLKSCKTNEAEHGTNETLFIWWNKKMCLSLSVGGKGTRRHFFGVSPILSIHFWVTICL